MNGQAVTFAVASGGGSITGATASTGSDGIATVGSWTLGTPAGANTMTASTLLKASLRGDRWWAPPAHRASAGQGGHAIAMQLSQAFDVMDWLRPSR